MSVRIGELALAAGVLTHEQLHAAQTTQQATGRRLGAVNGRKVGSLRDVAEAVEASSGRYVSFGLSSGYRVTIDREEARANAREVLQRYGVALDRSKRLQAALAAPGFARLGRAAERTERAR
jgi:hypothetical protein